jgi:tetratricopeptide (TPR) repeat protein
LAVHLDDAGPAKPPARPTNIAAYDRYLRARHLLRRRTVEDSKRAATLLTEVIRLDPTSAEAHSALSFAYLSIPLSEGPVDPFVEQSRQAAARALELDPSLAEAHAVRGRIHLHFDREIDAGRREMRRAFELDPRDPFVQHCYSQTLADDGRFEEAMAVSDRAVAQDPASVLALSDRAQLQFLARRYDDSVATSLKVLELEPHAPAAQNTLARAYEQLGKEQQAAAAYIEPLTLSERYRASVPAVRAAVEQRGLKGLWEKYLEALLRETEPRTYAIAATYARLGNHDLALAWLEKHAAARGGWMRALQTRPEWDPLRQDPRFQALLRRAG